MKVYIVESGDYEQRGIEAVFATLEAAIASCGEGQPFHEQPTRGATYRWWTREDSSQDITEYEVKA